MLQTREHTRATFSLHEIWNFVKTEIITNFTKMTYDMRIYLCFFSISSKSKAVLWLISKKYDEYPVKIMLSYLNISHADNTKKD